MIDLTWRHVLTATEVEAVSDLVVGATLNDGTAPLSEHVLLHLRHGGDADASHLLALDGGVLVGFAHLDLTDTVAGGAAELVVDPGHRRAGLGARLVSALLDRAASGSPAASRLRLWAHGEQPGAVALAGRFGFSRVRELWQMRRSLLAPLAEAHLPAGTAVRPFRVGSDEPEFLRVNNAAFAWHPEQGGWDLEQVKLREAEPWFDAAGFMLAVDAADVLLGFHWTKVHGGRAHEPIGEVYVLGVDPAARGSGLGAALTLAGLRHLRGLGLREVMLYVEADNTAAIRVYAGLGFTRWDVDVSYVRQAVFTAR